MKPLRLIVPAAAALLAAGCVSFLRPPTAAVPFDADWRWVQGAVFVPTNCVNEAQQWDEYDPVVNERELGYAGAYGINVVRAYLHYYVYLKKPDVLLADIEDFLRRADAHGIRVEFVFFDDCWNQPPAELLQASYRYPDPLPGVHNSRWLVSPGKDVLDHYEAHRLRLKAYVQDIVSAHRDDRRVLFWEIYNEPTRTGPTERLERDAAAWIKETGTRIPATATGAEFSGEPYSDFKSWHEYGAYDIRGGDRTLCTECMNRDGQDVPGIVSHYRGRVGYIFWELGIGRDNCRFAWSENRDKPRPDEATRPFHGIVYPDGHPWSVGDVRALLGEARYASTAFFRVRYFKDAGFRQEAKVSITPSVDFDLPDEAGVGSPDASAGVPRTDYSIEYQASVAAGAAGSYRFRVETDGAAELQVDGREVDASGATLAFDAGSRHSLVLRYAHRSGPTRLHLLWSGPGLAERAVPPAGHPEGI